MSFAPERARRRTSETSPSGIPDQGAAAAVANSDAAGLEQPMARATCVDAHPNCAQSR
jgi:hypothetical protein